MKTPLDIERIAELLRAERRGKVSAGGGYFGALQLAAEVETRFRTSGGHDPSWSEQQLVPLSPKTLEQLETLAKQTHATPTQVAALLLENAVHSAMSGK